MTKRDPKHLAWIRTLPCSVPRCRTLDPIEAHHVRTAANSGTGIKPPDGNCVPLCHSHHREHDRIGKRTFSEKYGIDLAAIAASLANRPPDGLF